MFALATSFYTPPANTKTYPLSLHDALPISRRRAPRAEARRHAAPRRAGFRAALQPDAQPLDPAQRRLLADDAVLRRDRKSTRLNSSHVEISYAVFCLKKKKNKAMSHSYCL